MVSNKIVSNYDCFASGSTEVPCVEIFPNAQDRRDNCIQFAIERYMIFSQEYRILSILHWDNDDFDDFSIFLCEDWNLLKVSDDPGLKETYLIFNMGAGKKICFLLVTLVQLRC